MAIAIIENMDAYKETDLDRAEIVTECNACEYYRRGECGLSGLEMTPDDYCSKAVRAEA